VNEVLAILGDGAALAERAWLADAPAVQDQGVGRAGPVGWRQRRAQLLLDFLGVVGFRDAYPVRHTEDVPIDGKAGHAERVPKDDVRRLAADAWQRDEGVHRAGDLAAVTLHERRGHARQGSRFRAEEPRRLDLRLELRRRRPGERPRVGVAAEERRRDLVDPFVRALRGENRRDEQLVRVREVQFGVGTGVLRRELLQDPARAGRQCTLPHSVPVDSP
jgi:hypothetical protein